MNSRNQKQPIIVAAISLLLTIVLSACQPVAPTAESVDPAKIVEKFYQLVNAKDIDKAMALAADDYVMNDPSGTYNKADAAKQWKSVVDAGLSFEQTNFKNTNGRVTSCYLVRAASGSEIDKGCDNVTHVRDGKIIFDGLQSAENIWIVQSYYAALNKGNMDAVAKYIADEAVFINPTGNYKNKNEIMTSLRAQAKEGLTFELSNFRIQKEKGRVVYDYVVKQKGEILDKGTDGVTKVKDGMIVFDGTEKTEPAN
jgi:ketosteroid isomerase-like protein